MEQPDVFISSEELWVEQPDVLRAAAYADAAADAQQTQTQTPSRSRAAPSARIQAAQQKSSSPECSQLCLSSPVCSHLE
ncbi:MAG: hypothetical protein GY820_11270, partial [Gammaproteobacteria bacterium]|nr:hypothetical protein [Gammaproteobacteria bacterium]